MRVFFAHLNNVSALPCDFLKFLLSVYEKLMSQTNAVFAFYSV